MQIFWAFRKFSDSGMRFEIRIEGLFSAQVKHHWVPSSAPNDGELWFWFSFPVRSGVACKFNLGIGKALKCMK